MTKLHTGFLCVFLAVAFLCAPLTPAWAEGDGVTLSATAPNVAYDRVMKTGEIRCGYFVWPPLFDKDLKTGALSGIFHDIAQEVGFRTDLKVIFTGELSFGTYVEDLATRKYDMECSGGWPTPARAKLLAYVPTPLFYVAYVPVVRADDARFDDDVSKLNAPDVRVVDIDGEQTQIVRRYKFPKSQDVSLPQTATKGELLINVITKKADVTFLDSVSAQDFIDKNPGKIKIVPSNQPIKLIPQTFSMGLNEPKLQSLINIAFSEMLLDGTVDRILDKYDPEGTKFYRAARPFQVRGER